MEDIASQENGSLVDEAQELDAATTESSDDAAKVAEQDKTAKRIADTESAIEQLKDSQREYHRQLAELNKLKDEVEKTKVPVDNSYWNGQTKDEFLESINEEPAKAVEFMEQIVMAQEKSFEERLGKVVADLSGRLEKNDPLVAKYSAEIEKAKKNPMFEGLSDAQLASVVDFFKPAQAAAATSQRGTPPPGMGGQPAKASSEKKRTPQEQAFIDMMTKGQVQKNTIA